MLFLFCTGAALGGIDTRLRNQNSWNQHLSHAVLAKSAIASLGSQRQQHQAASCAREGYVFIECQAPAADLTESGLNPSFLSSASIDQLQDECNYLATCVAFSTDGLLYKASVDSGKVGPLSKVQDCIQSGRGSVPSDQQCKGTYIYDGSIVKQPVLVSADDAGAEMPLARVTSVPVKVAQQYVRGQNRGGPGRVGISHCSLC